MSAFTFRLDRVLDHRVRQEDLVRQELAAAIAAVAAQQERAVAARRRVEDETTGFRELASGTSTLADLRAKHHDLAIARARAAHETTVVAQLEAVADERRADLLRASQDREALARLRRTAEDRHRAEELRVEANALDELALRRAGRGPHAA
ncbi:MAG TPA: flagellar export protein FliJ [Miltoncostaeaceae bacterium]|nr:flagellar export protein FliJ [Miltoncostaeaceae bacterium]